MGLIGQGAGQPLADDASHSMRSATAQLSQYKSLRKLQLGVRVGGVIENALIDSRVQQAVEQASQLVRQNSVVHTVESDSDLTRNAVWQQGDAALSTKQKFCIGHRGSNCWRPQWQQT